jgi:hypothetical protein
MGATHGQPYDRRDKQDLARKTIDEALQVISINKMPIKVIAVEKKLDVCATEAKPEEETITTRLICSQEQQRSILPEEQEPLNLSEFTVEESQFYQIIDGVPEKLTVDEAAQYIHLAKRTNAPMEVLTLDEARTAGLNII